METQSTGPAAQPAQPVQPAQPPQPAPPIPPLVPGKIKFNTSEGFEFVDPADISHIEGEGSQSSIHFIDKRMPLIISYTLKDLQESNMLDPAVFMRVHKSYIVNTNMICRYLKEDGGSLVIKGVDELIPVSKTYRDAVIARINAMN